MTRELTLIMIKERGTHQMYACRGQGKGCKRNTYREKKTQCVDCIGPLDDSLTLEDVERMIKKGDA